MTTPPLADQLTVLGLHYAASQLADLIATATKKRLGPLEVLELVVEREAEHRARRGLERRITRGRIGRFKPMAEFDWTWPKRLDRDAIEAALRLEFLDGARNIVFSTDSGGR
jgi:DNA replication protein DnaC